MDSFSDCLPDMLLNLCPRGCSDDTNFYLECERFLADFSFYRHHDLPFIYSFRGTKPISFIYSHHTNRSLLISDFAGTRPISCSDVVLGVSGLPPWWSLSRSTTVPHTIGLVVGLFNDFLTTSFRANCHTIAKRFLRLRTIHNILISRGCSFSPTNAPYVWRQLLHEHGYPMHFHGGVDNNWENIFQMKH